MVTAPRGISSVTHVSPAVRRLVVVASFGALALAAANFFHEWVLFTETTVRLFLFGA